MLPIIIQCCEPSLVEVNGTFHMLCDLDTPCAYYAKVPSLTVIKSWNLASMNECSDSCRSSSDLKRALNETPTKEENWNQNSICVPGVCYIKIDKTEAEQTAVESDASGLLSAYKGRSIKAVGGCVIDWGAFIELRIPCKERARFQIGEVRTLDSIDIMDRGKKLHAELYHDNGAKLLLQRADMQEPVCYSLGRGNSGKLGTLDVGSESLLSVSLNIREHKQRLILIRSIKETVLDITGDFVGIVSGYPECIKRLPTFSGHELRTRYELKAGKYNMVDRELGFFIRECRLPKTAKETALCYTEAAILGRGEEARRYLSDELNGIIDDTEISDFFGRGSFALPMPEPYTKAYPLPHFGSGDVTEGADAVAVIGVFKNERDGGEEANTEGDESSCTVLRPELCLFRMKDMKITDIEAFD